MALEQIYEGTWEEVSGHAAALRGKRVRLLVLSDAFETERSARLHERANELLEEADAIVREPGAPLSDPNEREWAEAVESKYRKQGIVR